MEVCRIRSNPSYYNKQAKTLNLKSMPKIFCWNPKKNRQTDSNHFLALSKQIRYYYIMQKILSIIALTLLISTIKAELGVDVSQLFSVENYTCAKNNGITFGIARGYCSFGGLDHNTIQSLENMKKAGLKTDVYMFPCRGKLAIAQVDEMINNIPSTSYDRIWIDIETNPSSGCTWSGYTSDQNCQYTLELLEAVKARNRTVGIYASRYMWNQIYGSTTACQEAADGIPLWYAHYDMAPTFTDFSPFGGWQTPTIKQYQGTSAVCGASVDRNWKP